MATTRTPPDRAERVQGFVAHTLLDWGLDTLIPAASLVVSELVTNSTIHAGTDIDLSISWHLGALRLAVGDRSPELPRQRFAPLDVRARGLFVVAGLSRAVGVLPTADGGQGRLGRAQRRPATLTDRHTPS